MMLALAGGVGGARLAVGLAQVLPPRELAIVVNTGDDFEHLGLSVCPDLDTVVYTLANVHNAATGWGRADETWSFMHEVRSLGGETWFQLGDRDLAMHVLRTRALREGTKLSQITEQLSRCLGVRHRIIPMSETSVRTRVRTARGELSFQDYFVRLRCKPRVSGFAFQGAAKASIPSPLQKIFAARTVRAVVICPSNPFVSVAPILSVPAIARWVRQRRAPVVAISPIVGGTAIKGPAGKMMRELRVEVSALGIARHYGDRVDAWVIDTRDAKLQHDIEALGHDVLVTDTMMTDRAASARLAREVVRFTRRLAMRHAR